MSKRTKNAFHRNESKSRRLPTRQEAKSIFAVVEGQTEEIYLKKIKSVFRLSAVTIEFWKKSGNAKNLMASLKNKHKREQKKKSYDEFWYIFDSEIPLDKTTPEHCEVAEKNKYCVGISNPCFEYWLLLHTKFTTINFTDSEQASNPLSENSIEKFNVPYSKNEKELKNFFTKLLEKNPKGVLDFACNNSKKALKQHQISYNWQEIISNNPSTNVHKFIESIFNDSNA